MSHIHLTEPTFPFTRDHSSQRFMLCAHDPLQDHDQVHRRSHGFPRRSMDGSSGLHESRLSLRKSVFMSSPLGVAKMGKVSQNKRETPNLMKPFSTICEECQKVR